MPTAFADFALSSAMASARLARPRALWLQLRNVPILRMLQLEEALFRTDRRSWFITNQWDSAQPAAEAVVLGISGRPEQMLHVEAAQRSGIPVIKRFTGGGTVVVDSDTLFASFIVAYSISDTVWKKLPPDVQKAMADVAEEIIPSACQQVQKSDDETKKSLEAAGVRFETLRPDVNAKFKDLMKGVAKTWADGLDGRGKHGSDAVKEFDAAVAAIPAK